ncbi:LysR family transcriptional regulator [Bordetella sp. 15P40C-2]|uniref:LysR family transcriptional regulator n=1 Tax=Bordetella sp. 15P40C-2 TaxID=2572246 RepID=UPI0013297C2E|nr:LysR family transcriptional regulator [Bordetella sp. 15P40C-2]MVW70669.1 LysR family transcriptional regulator [Bordetella sp. 15P40C-2]
MDFRQLRYFATVADTLSFSRAAEQLHMSQPPLSQQIKLLEEDLGVQLFERTRRVVRLTEPGRLFYEQAQDILRRYEDARELCALSRDGRAGKLRVAFTASVPMFEAFPRLLRAFRQAYPRVDLDLRHLSTGEQLQALEADEIDIGFLRPSHAFRAPGSIEVVPLWSDELVLAVSADHRLANSDAAPTLMDLAREDFILFPQALGCGLFEHITTLATQAGFAPRIVQEVRENSTTLALVAANMGISIVPSIYEGTKPPGVVFKWITNAPTQSRIVMVTRVRPGNASVPLFAEQAARIVAADPPH